MKRLISTAVLALALSLASFGQAAAKPKTFHAEIEFYSANRKVLTLSYWQDGENIRREYAQNIHTTYITNKDGVYIIVNQQDRGIRLNPDSKDLEGRLIEKYAVWPMADVDQFIKDWKAQLVGEVKVSRGGKQVVAQKYQYKLDDAKKTTATLLVDKEARVPIEVTWGKNVNIDKPLSELDDASTREYKTTIKYIKYSIGEAISADLFKAPSVVVDRGAGILKPKSGGGGSSG